ncbi:MAG: right-handed parallel beta-helix repeat-containing protein [Deltaproteobacteria bacterium]|nr:right-handed parallel beta-helix repeat-containing protein [Deltaproteobacteria bacterium]
MSLRTSGLSVAFLTLLLSAQGLEAAEPAPSRTLASDTVWRGVIDVTGDVIVAPGATLLILPGTTARFAKGPGKEGGKLVVRGTLVAQGRADEPIVFTSASDSPGVGDWSGIVFEKAKDRVSRLRHCRIEYAQSGIQGRFSSLFAEECLFRRNETGLEALQSLEGGLFDCEVAENEVGVLFQQSSGMRIEKCRVQRNAKIGILCENASSPRIANCLVSDNAGHGIVCALGSSPEIEGNRISGHERGIFVEFQSNPLISRNEILGNQTGIWMEKLVYPRVLANAIFENGVGIYCNRSAYPQVRGNNVYDNRRFAFAVGDRQSSRGEKSIPYRAQGTAFAEVPREPGALPRNTKKLLPFQGSEDGLVDARGNWWGRETVDQIRTLGENGNVSAIEDGNDQPLAGYLGREFPRDRVAFAPWEDCPLADAGRPASRYSGIRGTVSFEGRPVAGVRVHVHEAPGGAPRGEGFSYSPPTGKDGAFSLTLRPGRYGLVAKGPNPPFPNAEPGRGDLFGAYGGNSVVVPDGSFVAVDIPVTRRGVDPTISEPGVTSTRGDGSLPADRVRNGR